MNRAIICSREYILTLSMRGGYRLQVQWILLSALHPRKYRLNKKSGLLPRKKKKNGKTWRSTVLHVVAGTGLEPATSGLWEIQSLCVTVLFCWVWWYCVPRLKTDFVPCVQKGAASCWTVPNPFGGSFGGKSAKRILAHSNQINVQLWFYWEMQIPTSQGSRTGKANEPVYKFYSPVRSCTQALCA